MGQQIADRGIRSLSDFYAHAIAIEREAADRYQEFEAYFADRNGSGLANLCRTLATVHNLACRRHQQAGATLELPRIDPSRYRWIEAAVPSIASRDFVYRTVATRQLFEIAQSAESDAARFFDDIADGATDGSLSSLARQTAGRARENAHLIAAALENVPSPGLDWEQMLAAGGGPCLALGAERRTRRGPAK